jgi:3-carboxy-cis,cis-muconate cycloisomerase
MSAHIIDSEFLGNLYSTPAMREVWGDHGRLQSWLDVEAALARAEAACGVIPAVAAAEITLKARIDAIDTQRVIQGIAETMHPIVPLVRELTRSCNGDLGQYVHWGATTQDIIDTGLVLQIRRALALMVDDLRGVKRELARLAKLHRDTVMAGRTNGQQALPTTFGYKAAVWLAQIDGLHRRLEAMRPRVLVGQFSGAVGTLASLGEIGLAVREKLCAELGLGVPAIPWNAARDGFIELVCATSHLTGALGNIAHEIISLQRTEIAEVEEPHATTKVGSSTMPHKRNPMMCESVVGLARLARQHASLAIDATTNEHERDRSTMQMEWSFVGQSCLYAAGALAQMRLVLAGLVVHPERMRANLALTGGAMLSEAVMMRLAPTIGRTRAHDLVHRLAMRAHDESASFPALLRADPLVAATMPESELAVALDPQRYTGLSGVFVDRALAAASA